MNILQWIVSLMPHNGYKFTLICPGKRKLLYADKEECSVVVEGMFTNTARNIHRRRLFAFLLAKRSFMGGITFKIGHLQMSGLNQRVESLSEILEHQALQFIVH